jgi:hypothetical protein
MGIGSLSFKRFYIWDGGGQEWSVSRKDLKKIEGDAKKFADFGDTPVS